MPITPEAMQLTPFYLMNFGGAQPPPPMGTDHIRYDWTDCRVNVVIQLVGGLQQVTLEANPHGDTIYLPFSQNQVTSVRLPWPAPAGVTGFLTASLSGCKIYIDTVAGSNDVIVYHANSAANSPDQVTSETQPTTELPKATTELDRLHQAAQAHWTQAPHSLKVNDGTSLAKPRYNMRALDAVERKAGQRRGSVRFTGGTVVAGFAAPDGWEFYFQTFGDTEYDRPIYSWKRARSLWQVPAHHDGLTMRVLECQRFYP